MGAGGTGDVTTGPPTAHLGDSSSTASELGLRLSRSLIEFYKDLHGRGPTGVRTVLSPELAATAMYGVLTAGERTLVAGGKIAEVEEMRLRTAEVVRPRLIALAEEVLGLEVTASVTGLCVSDDLATEAFLLAPPPARPG
jgi:uncharacterized protein YbcI